MGEAPMGDAGFLNLTLAGRAPDTRRGETPWLAWEWLDDGIIRLLPRQPASASLVLSAGIHGNETAPVELICQLLEALLSGRMPLAPRLLVMLGNPGALRAGKRYLDYDMNRLFPADEGPDETRRDLPDNRETLRGRLLQRHLDAFYRGNSARWHLDLHTAIRGSRHVRFGLLPYRPAGYDPGLIGWLQAAGLDALVRHSAAGSTFTHFSSERFSAASVTLELGKALPFGENDLTQFSAIRAALWALVNGGPWPQHPGPPMKKYRVSQQITRTQADFTLLIPAETLNFTSFHQGYLLARETGREYRVREDREWVLFPNPNVAPGLRAGLMLVEDKDSGDGPLGG